MSNEASAAAAAAVTPSQFLNHWQGHRRLTRRVVEAFPDDQLFTFSIGGMRTFGALTLEMLGMAEPMLLGLVTNEWNSSMKRDPAPKAELLRRWDTATKTLDEQWSRIPAARFQETATAFGQFTGIVSDLLLYVVDNEIHHRGQGYVYLRALGVEPPPFYERT